jgi:hypothetical protein
MTPEATVAPALLLLLGDVGVKSCCGIALQWSNMLERSLSALPV